MRQTFVRGCQWWQIAPTGQINDEQWHRFSPEFCKGLGFNPNGARGPLSPCYRAPSKRWRTRDASSRRVGLAPEVIADPEERLSVRSQVALLDGAAIALNDDCLGFTLARDFDPRELGLLYYVMASSQTLGDALKRIVRYSHITNEALVVGYREENRLIVDLSYSGVPRHSERHQIEFCMFALLRLSDRSPSKYLSRPRRRERLYLASHAH